MRGQVTIVGGTMRMSLEIRCIEAGRSGKKRPESKKAGVLTRKWCSWFKVRWVG